jgi:hypothetical protein
MHGDLFTKVAASVQKARRGLDGWRNFCGTERLHRAQGYRTRRDVFQVR